MEDKRILLSSKLSTTSSSSASSSGETLHQSTLSIGSSLNFDLADNQNRFNSSRERAIQKAKLSKTFSTVNSQSGPPMIRNQLAEQNNKPLNQTFTFGSRLVDPRQRQRQTRSSSIDSDFGDYSIHGALTGMFPRNVKTGLKSALSNHIGRKAFSQGQTSDGRVADKFVLAKNFTSAATIWSKCAKLPSLNDCSANRKCCQKFASKRTQHELAKYKEALNNN